MNGFLMLAVMLSGSSDNSQWQTDYGEALQAAQSDHRPLLIVLDNPANPDERLQQVANADATQTELLRSYQLCHVDVSTPYGEKVAEAFGATRFPYMAITDRRGGRLIYQNTGRLSSSDWTTVLVNHANGTSVSRANPVASQRLGTPLQQSAVRQPTICYS